MIHEEYDDEIDFSWLLFIGHNLLLYSVKEVGRMTLAQLLTQYRHYKNDYDFKLSRKSYAVLDDEADHDGEFIRD